MSALQDDEETQKRGIVDIIYHVQHASNEKDRQMITNGSKYVYVVYVVMMTLIDFVVCYQ